MSPAVFIDANVPIYAAGGDHPYKEPCARILRMAAEQPQPFVTDSEVLQELMHRYLASGAVGAGPGGSPGLRRGDEWPCRTRPCRRRSFGVGAGGQPSRRQRPRPGSLGGDAAVGSSSHHLGGHRL